MLVSDKEMFVFSQNGENFVLDPNSQLFWRITSELILDSDVLENNYSKLLNYGFFKNHNQTKEKKLFSQFDLSNLVINPSTKCNLDCWFCYSNQYKNYNSNELNLKEIKSIIQKALDFKIRNKSNSPLSISMFFASEITIDFNIFLEVWEYIEDIKVDYNFPIYMFLPPTNLMDFSNDFVEFIDKYGYLAVSLNFLNEKQRKTVVQNLNRFENTVEKHCILPLNAHMTSFFDIYTQLLNHFDCVSMRPVRIPHDSRYPWTQDSLELFSKNMQTLVFNLLDLNDEELLQMLLSLGSSDYFVRYLDRIISRAKYTERCPAGKRAAAVNPDFRLYPCSGFIEIEEYSFGTFDDLNNADLNKVISSNLNSKPECKECPIRFYCGGPCEDWKSKLNISKFESVNHIECTINLIYFKNSIFLISKLYEKNPEILTNYAKEKGIEYMLSYPLNFEDFVLFFS